MARERVVGIDLGTTALKGCLFDLEGNLLRAAEAGYPIDRPRRGWAEHDPAAWLRALDTVLAELGDHAAIGICSQVNTHVFVDDGGDPLRPAILWQDQRCAAVAEELGVPSSFLPARAEWVRREEPETWERTRWILSPKDFVNLRLTGVAAADPIASFDIVDDRFADRLPPLRAIDEPLGTANGAVVVTATMDAWGNVYGSGVFEHGDAMEVAGTSEIVGVLSRDSHDTPGVVSFAAVDGLHLHAGPTQAGGAAVAWFADLVRLPIAEVLELAATVDTAPVFLPHLLGERAPLWDPDVRGGFVGVSSDHSTAHFARAVLLGVAFSARHLLEEIEKAAGVEADALRSSGGGAQSDLWCQLKADVLGRPIERLRVRQSGCLGAALMAASGAGLVDGLRDTPWARVERVFEPVDSYDELYAVYRGLYHALKPTHDELRRSECEGSKAELRSSPAARR
jgi:xylulokinase